MGKSFIYNISFQGVAPAAVVAQNLAIQSGNDFAWLKATFHASIANAAQTYNTRVLPTVSVLLTDTGSSEQLMNVPVPVSCFFGTGEIPFILTTPRIFRANSNINIQVSNLEPVNTYNIWLSFIGEKL